MGKIKDFFNKIIVVTAMGLAGGEIASLMSETRESNAQRPASPAQADTLERTRAQFERQAHANTGSPQEYRVTLAHANAGRIYLQLQQLSFMPRDLNVDAITAAIDVSGSQHVDLATILTWMNRESTMNSEAESGICAVGFGQFTEATWVDIWRRHGAHAGHSDLQTQASNFFNALQNGRLDRTRRGDCEQRRTARTAAGGAELEFQNFLDRRAMPNLNLTATTLYIRHSREEFLRAHRRDPNITELYLMHFLGTQGGISFTRAMRTNRNQRAASLFPDAARSNPNIFGNRSLAQVYTLIDQRVMTQFRGISRAIRSGIDGSPGAPLPERRTSFIDRMLGSTAVIPNMSA